MADSFAKWWQRSSKGDSKFTMQAIGEVGHTDDTCDMVCAALPPLPTWDPSFHEHKLCLALLVLMGPISAATSRYAYEDLVNF